MKTKQFRITLAILLAAILAVVSWQVLRQRESQPVYQGKPLAYWLEGYHPYPGRWQPAWSGRSTAGTSMPPRGTSPPTQLEAEKAVYQAGTNAFPILVRMLEKHDSPVTLATMQLLQKQQLIKIPFTPSGIQHDQAFRGIKTLALNGAEPKLVMPVLIKSLSDPSDFVRSQAARTLGAFEEKAEPAVPALVEMWRKESPQSRYNAREMAARALLRIDPVAAARAGVN